MMMIMIIMNKVDGDQVERRRNENALQSLLSYIPIAADGGEEKEKGEDKQKKRAKEKAENKEREKK